MLGYVNTTENPHYRSCATAIAFQVFNEKLVLDSQLSNHA